ncbi:TetR/AcrR family transcriptional regulator [Alkalihalobacillus sp. 1P02AB]|uniref:TetR/AcrR family transcriptional regulator n=1 Tax=Alkalihalobacillus sp. 1P02AB TaxID=3132260 RepID=UPI0039A6CDF8
MDRPKTDRRIIRTKKMIRDALTKLILKKGFEGLTVRDITELANINRGTFYLHYRDKYDLLEKCEMEIIEELKKIRIQTFLSQKDFRKNRQLMNQPSPYMVKLLECVKEHSELMTVLLGPKGDPSFHVKLKKEMMENMERLIKEHRASLPATVPIDYISAISISSQLGVIQHWLDTGMKQSPIEVATYMRKFVFGNVYSDEQNKKSD